MTQRGEKAVLLNHSRSHISSLAGSWEIIRGMNSAFPGLIQRNRDKQPSPSVQSLPPKGGGVTSSPVVLSGCRSRPRNSPIPVQPGCLPAL